MHFARIIFAIIVIIIYIRFKNKITFKFYSGTETRAQHNRNRYRNIINSFIRSKFEKMTGPFLLYVHKNCLLDYIWTCSWPLRSIYVNGFTQGDINRLCMVINAVVDTELLIGYYHATCYH